MVEARTWRWVPIAESFAILGWATLTAMCALRVWSKADSAIDWVISAICAVAGYLVADLLSGIAHWLFDTYWEVDTRFIGPLAVAPFREHHRLPKAMVDHGFLELMGGSAMLLLPLIIGIWFANLGIAIDSGAAVMSIALFLTNLFHKWAHAGEAPGWVRWLQRRRLILAPEVHAPHHEGGYIGDYCVTVGWMNPALDYFLAVGKFRRG